MVVVFLMAMTVVPMTQGTGKAHAAAAQPQAVRIELVNAPEGQEFYLGLDEDALSQMLYHQVKVRAVFQDGSEVVMDVGDSEAIDRKNDIYAETGLKYNGKEGDDDRLQQGNNTITITYREITYDQEGDERILQTLSKSFTVKGVIFQGYDPALENGQNLKSEISTWGNEILFSNGELWKAPMGGLNYSKKDNIKGIVKEAYNNIYIDQQDTLTVENLKGEICESFSDVKDFGEDYVLQKDGTLTAMTHYWVRGDAYIDNYLKWETKTLATNIEQCVSVNLGGSERLWYTIDKEGIARWHEVPYNKEDVTSGLIDTAKVTSIYPGSGWDSVYYLTEAKDLKRYGYEDTGSGIDPESKKTHKIIRGNIERFCDEYAVGTDGKSYTLDGKKAFDSEVIACKRPNDPNEIYVATRDENGDSYLYLLRLEDLHVGGIWHTYLVAKDFKEFSDYGYITTAGTQKGLPGETGEESNVLTFWPAELRVDGTVYWNGYELLTNVVGIGCVAQYSDILIMTRKDGSIWLFNKYEKQGSLATPQKFSQKLLDEISDTKSEEKNINELTFSYQREMKFTGGEVKPTITIWDGGYVLQPGTDYDVTYKNNINEGTATMTVVGKGDYIGKRDLLFTIKKMNITQNTPVSPNKKNQAIHGASKFTKVYGSKPFYLGAKTTGKGKLTYKSNNRSVIQINQAGKATIKGPGRAIITVTAAATANYNAATKQVLITVKPKKATGLKVKAAKKKMTVRWKRDPKADGYQLTYAKNSKFKKGKKNILIRKNKITKQVIKKVKPKKTYYVKVRAYKKVGKTNLYGAYSKARKIKIKK